MSVKSLLKLKVANCLMFIPKMIKQHFIVAAMKMCRFFTLKCSNGVRH